MSIVPMLVHLSRLLVIGALVIGLNRLGQTNRTADQAEAPTIEQVQHLLPEAVSLSKSQIDAAVWSVLDKEQKQIAMAMMTSPQSDHIVGYAGPSNLLILLDGDGKVSQTTLISSSDTVDHVSRVAESPLFWAQFQGRTLGQRPERKVDGVSGATLTSLAMAEAIDYRLSGQRLSLRFPEELQLAEVQPLFPSAERIEPDARYPGLYQVLPTDGPALGALIRTGPLESGVAGYQGPTELLIGVNQDGIVEKVRLRRSYDNEPYVRYNRMEASFWAKFVGRSLHDLSQIDVEAEGIEGVSGATMTSMAIVETIRRSAARQLRNEADQASRSQPVNWLQTIRGWNWSPGELATLCVALLVIPWSLTRLRGVRWLRPLWQIAVMAVIVGLSGNLISVALLAGWSSSLPRIGLAPGLIALVAVSLALPAVMGRNVYCDHVCPHGILQQWTARRPWRSRTRVAGPARSTSRAHAKVWLSRLLQASAILVLIMAATWIIWRRPSQLTIFEPFDVYAWRVGLSSSLIVWLLSMFLAIKEPMGYCRLACPTGKLLETVRRKRTGGRIGWSDMLLGLTAAAIWIAVGIIH